MMRIASRRNEWIEMGLLAAEADAGDM